MEDDDSANISSAEEGDCLGNRPALPDACPAQDEMLEAEDDARSELPPQDVDLPSSSPTSHFSESPIKRRPGSKAGETCYFQQANQSPCPYVSVEEGDRTGTPWLLLCEHSR